jgi:hypothetical protein
LHPEENQRSSIICHKKQKYKASMIKFVEKNWFVTSKLYNTSNMSGQFCMVDENEVKVRWHIWIKADMCTQEWMCRQKWFPVMFRYWEIDITTTTID